HAEDEHRSAHGEQLGREIQITADERAQVLSGEHDRELVLADGAQSALEVFTEELAALVDAEDERLSLILRQVLLRDLRREDVVNQNAADYHFLIEAEVGRL